MPAKPATKSANRPQQVRIIGGQWKRTPLPVINQEGLRPTPDRVRETVFNWLGFLFDTVWEGREVLDMFAGSGALGFEAASRGASQVILLENHSPAIQQLQANKEKLRATQITIQRGDALQQAAKMQANQQAFDLIFIDPPYQSQLSQAALDLAAKLLKPSALVYLELPRQQELPDWLVDWDIVRQDQAGMVAYFLLAKK